MWFLSSLGNAPDLFDHLRCDDLFFTVALQLRFLLLRGKSLEILNDCPCPDFSGLPA
jgi:hypothetical protein